MADFKVDVDEVNDLAGDVNRAAAGVDRAVADAGREVGPLVVKGARARASSMGGVWAKAAPQIRASTAGAAAEVGVPSGIASAAFFGTLRRTGWYAAPRYRGGPRQHPVWVGDGWEVGGPGGPYAINPAVAQGLPRILDVYADAVEDVCSRAFPN